MVQKAIWLWEQNEKTGLVVLKRRKMPFVKVKHTLKGADVHRMRNVTVSASVLSQPNHAMFATTSFTLEGHCVVRTYRVLPRVLGIYTLS